MIKVLFSDRVKIQTTPTMQTMIAFLEHRGWLNVEKVMKDMKD